TKAKTGAKLNELVSLLITLENVTYEVAHNFVLEMIASQVLIPELTPNVTGDNLLNKLNTFLSNITIAPELTSSLTEIKNQLSNEQPKIKNYSEIQSLLNTISLNSITSKNIFHTDLYLKTQRSTVNQTAIENIISQSKDLLVLA